MALSTRAALTRLPLLLLFEGSAQEARRGASETVAVARGTSQRAASGQRGGSRLVRHRGRLAARPSGPAAAAAAAAASLGLGRPRHGHVLRQRRPDEGPVRRRAWPRAGLQAEAVEIRACSISSYLLINL